MDTRALALLIIVAILVIATVAVVMRRRKTSLKERFGAEYDRTVQQTGDPSRAEEVLAERQRRVEGFSIRTLSPVDREAFALEWSSVQRRFVDDPAAAVSAADRLVDRVMSDRGYPMSDFEQRAADVSVSYPGVVQNYRAAHEIALRHSQGKSTTEELRRAMVHYRSLFDELLSTPTASGIHTRGVTHERAS